MLMGKEPYHLAAYDAPATGKCLIQVQQDAPAFLLRRGH